MPTQDSPLLDIAIVGSGFSGLCMVIKLKEVDIHSTRTLKKTTDVGGTWWENICSGAACDVQSHLDFSSFVGKPDRSHGFFDREESQNYILNCTSRHGLKEHIQYSRNRCAVQ